MCQMARRLSLSILGGIWMPGLLRRVDTMSGMVFHSYRLRMAACEARDRAIAAVDAQPDALVIPLDTAVAIIMSVASAEAFINELAESAAVRSSQDKKPPAHV